MFEVALNVLCADDGCALGVELIDRVFVQVPGLPHGHMSVGHVVCFAERDSALLVAHQPVNQCLACAVFIKMLTDFWMAVKILI